MKPKSKKKKSNERAASELSLDLKYELYEASVQNPESDIKFINKEFKRLKGRRPLTLREDFAGTGLMAYEWSKQSKEHFAWGIDLDPIPLDYGKNVHAARYSSSVVNRVDLIQGNVLDAYPFKPDVVVAFNFSYFIFKRRRDLLNYFKSVRRGISSEGLFFIDLFGGTEAYQPLEERTVFKNHTYFWDCERYNPITAECFYSIHFKYKNIKYKQVFTYDWRMWTIAELREILKEAGFTTTFAYWEGEEEDGSGDGHFKVSEEAENCESWVTYIAALP